MGGWKGAATSSNSLNNKGRQSAPPSPGLGYWFLTSAKLASVAPLAVHVAFQGPATNQNRALEADWFGEQNFPVGLHKKISSWGHLENVLGNNLAFSIEILLISP